MNKRSIILVSFLLLCAPFSIPVTVSGAGNGSVLLYGHGVGKTDISFLAARFLTPPDASYDIVSELKDTPPKATDFEQASVVVVGSLDKRNPTPWNDEDVALVEKWVSGGGTLVMIGNSPVILSANGQNLTALSRLLGARNLQSAGEGYAAQDHEMMEGISDVNWIEPNDWSAADITIGQPLIGNGKKAFASVNSIGEGNVFYFGKDVSRLRNREGLEPYAKLIGRAILSGTLEKKQSAREPWLPVALGAPINRPVDQVPLLRDVKSMAISNPVVGSPVELVINGVSVTIIVTPDNPSRAAGRAAEILREELRKATGAKVSIVKESALEIVAEEGAAAKLRLLKDGSTFSSAIFVGDTQLAAKEGLTSDGLPLEGYRMLTKENLIFLVGNDRRPDGFGLKGSQFAVTSFLERHCGIRWLWPGELGSIYPSVNSLSVGPFDESDAPALRIRKLREGSGGAKRFENDQETGAIRGVASGKRTAVSMGLLGKTLEDQLARHEPAPDWFEKVRLGQSYVASATHAYSGWWNRFGGTHPEWFSLQPSGYRSQSPPRELFCQSQPPLVQQIARETVAKYAEDPQRDVVSIALNDVGKNSYCFCKDCRSKDPVNGVPTPIRYSIGEVSLLDYYPSLSDRVVGFYSEIAKEVARLRPGARVGVTAYNAYRAAPLAARLPENSLLVFVGLNYFDSHTLEADRDNWNRWATQAPELILRPNTLHQGHAMPAVFVRKLAADLKQAAQTGMVGADFDSVVHHWSTQGLNYYVLSKLIWDPTLDPEKVIQDYCDIGFGPASKTIRSYFAVLETHTDWVADQVGELSRSVQQNGDDDEGVEAITGAESFITRIHRYYPLAKIEEWQRILDEARKECEADSASAARVDFLSEGLKYARLQTEFYSSLEAVKESPDLLKEVALKRREAFQKIFENQFYAIHFALVLWREEFFWKQAGITTGL